MSRIDQPLSEIKSGTHLVVVLDATLVRDHENLPVIAKDGSRGIKIRFNDNKLNHDKVFWEKSPEFRKLCKITSCDMSKPVIPQLKGKSIWMCVKEIKTMATNPNGSCDAIHVLSDFVAFDYIECTNPTQKPIISGDPCQHPKGEPLGVFVEYKDDGRNWVSSNKLMVKDIPQREYTKEEIEMQDVVRGVNVKTGEFHGNPKDEISIKLAIGLPPLTQEQQAKLELGKKIIAEGEGKQMTSLNEKNDKKISDEAESHGESNDNNHVEDDWSNL